MYYMDCNVRCLDILYAEKQTERHIGFVGRAYLNPGRHERTGGFDAGYLVAAQIKIVHDLFCTDSVRTAVARHSRTGKNRKAGTVFQQTVD